MNELRLLGTVELKRAGGGTVQSVTVQPKRLAVLAYLAAARPRGPHRRDVLLGLFWPELDTERARAALNKALHHLRTSLGPGAITSHGEEAVELDATVVTSDVARFEEALGAGRLDVALDVYAGDLLHGFFLSDAPGFEQWVEAERSRLRARAAQAAAALSATCEAAGDTGSALAAARRAVDLGSDEPAVRRLMTLLDAAGDRAGALAACDAFAATLRRELDVEPSPETQALAAAIRARAEARPPAGAMPAERVELPAARAPRAGVVGAREPAAQPAGAASSGETGGAEVSGRPLSAVPVATVPASAGPAQPADAFRLRRRWRHGPAFAAAAVVLVGAVAVLAYRGAPVERQLEPRRVLVLPFENRTLDGTLDPVGRMAADWIIDGVARMGGFEVVPSTAVWAAQGGGSAGDTADPGGAVRRMARELGAGTVLSGSYYASGGRILLQARVHDAASGRVLRPIGGVSVAADSLVHGIDLLRTRVLAAMAPVGDTVYHLRLAAAAPTYEAYREYITAMEAFVTGDPGLALRHYELAAAADSGWAMPRIAAAIMHMNLGNLAVADSVIAPLNAARERLGPLERGTVDMVLGMLHGRPAAVYEAVSILGRIAPGTINEYMIAETARRLNRPAEALQVLARMGPERGELRGWQPYWREAAWSHHMLGDHRAELAAARDARRRHPHSPRALELEARALAALGRVDEVRELVDERAARALSGTPTTGELMRMAFRELWWHGHEAAASEFAGRAVAWYRARAEEAPGNPGVRTDFALALLDAGQADQAAKLLRPLLAEYPDDPMIAATLAFAMARLDRPGEALQMSDRAALHVHPQGRTGPLNRLRGQPALLRAAAAAHLGDNATAAGLLREAELDGLWFEPDVLCRPDYAPLRGDAAFEAWRRPRTLPGGRR
jgi:DNA-binding SARP family transcriptional activator/TolB-like protein/tetratricopeptide (TPR) repeat protein